MKTSSVIYFLLSSIAVSLIGYKISDCQCLNKNKTMQTSPSDAKTNISSVQSTQQKESCTTQTNKKEVLENNKEGARKKQAIANITKKSPQSDRLSSTKKSQPIIKEKCDTKKPINEKMKPAKLENAVREQARREHKFGKKHPKTNTQKACKKTNECIEKFHSGQTNTK